MDVKAAILEACKFFSVWRENDPGGILIRFWPLYYVDIILQRRGVSGRAREDRMIKCFIRLCQKWERSNPEYRLTTTDLYWLALITGHVGIGDLVLRRLIEWAVNEDYQGFAERVKAFHIPGLSPKECAALILCPPDNLEFPPNHPLWLARGVRNKKEWQELDVSVQVIRDITNLRGIDSAFGRALLRASERKGKSDKIEYVSEYKDAQLIEDESEYMSDTDRLSLFLEKAGIPMDMLTDADASRILDILHAYDMGYDHASKKGVSLKDYYGGRADSEKTQRQRLFKKLRNMRDKVK